MHKLIASLLLVLSAAALLSKDPARATPSPRDHAAVRLAARASIADEAFARSDNATAGAYFELAVAQDIRVWYRVVDVRDDAARLDAVVVRNGVTLAEPDVQVALGTPAQLQLDDPALSIEFRIEPALVDE